MVEIRVPVVEAGIVKLEKQEWGCGEDLLTPPWKTGEGTRKIL